MLDLRPTDTFIDVAGDNSPVPEIYAELCGCTCYCQDIMYASGVNGTRIGGDACAMPLPDGFATKAALICSLEHFEGDGDSRLFLELGRVIRPGGRVAVALLYVHSTASVQTDPTISAQANVEFDPGTTVHCNKGWGNRHGRFYSGETLYQRIIKPAESLFEFNVYVLENVAHPHRYYCLHALLAERKHSTL